MHSPLPGAWDPLQCLSPLQRRQEQEEQATNLDALR